jgi:hypothetical protein
VLYAFGFDRIGVVVSDLYFVDPKPMPGQEGAERGVRLELRMLDRGDPRGSIYAARPIGVDRPILTQYADWISKFLQGNLGMSLEYKVSVSSLLGTVFKVGANSRFKQEATLIATSTLDAQIATGASTLLGETGTRSLPSVTSAGHVYLLEMEVAPFDPANSQCVSPASDPGAMLKVTIWATWQTQQAGATWWLANSSTATGQLANVASLISVPSSIINPPLGSILVAIQGAAGAGVPNVAVTLANPPTMPDGVITPVDASIVAT